MGVTPAGEPTGGDSTTTASGTNTTGSTDKDPLISWTIYKQWQITCSMSVLWLFATNYTSIAMQRNIF
jgi:hypothetical protein